MDTITTLLELIIPVLMVINAIRALYLTFNRPNKLPYFIQTIAFSAGTAVILLPDSLPPLATFLIELFVFLVLMYATIKNFRGSG